MFKKIEKPTAHDIWFVIRFFNARNMKPDDIHHQFCEVYGEHTMDDTKMCIMIRGEANHLWLMKIWCV
jgi:hypothetical protein